MQIYIRTYCLSKALAVLFLGVMLYLTGGCVKGKEKLNAEPDTRISIEAIDLTGENRLNSTISLSWFGTDADGYIVGYEISGDKMNWTYTTKQDSTFVFSIPEGSDTADVDLYVRAIDNDGNRDETPAYLEIPLKNTPPVASFDDERGPSDTTLAVATFFWTATDVDGDGTIQKVEVKFNDGEWYEISRGEQLISFVLDTGISGGSASAQLYYGTSNTAEPQSINGVLANAENTIYIRAVDIAGSESKTDTSATFYFKNKSPGVRTLWISGHSDNVTSVYREAFSNISLAYDFLPYGPESSEQLPKYWDPAFKLISRLYKVIFVNADGSRTFTNPVTGRSATLLDYMAPAIQAFTTNGGKSFITTKFGLNVQLNNLIGPYPIEDIVDGTVPGSQARIIPPDSGIVPVNEGGPYPKLIPVSFQTQVVPIVPSSDAQAFYRGQLTLSGNWTGEKIMASVRRPGNKLQQVFFAVQLHEYNRDEAALEQLFEEILINEF